MKTSTFLPSGTTILHVTRQGTTPSLDPYFDDPFTFGYYLAYLLRESVDESYKNHRVVPGQSVFQQYEPYFASLPTSLRLSPRSCENGLSLDEADLKDLDYRGHQYIHSIILRFNSTWDNLTASIADGTLHPQLNRTVASLISYSDYKWGFCLATSRAFVDIKGRMRLVPIGDLLNHDIQVNVDWNVTDEDDMIWVTNRDIQTDEELMNTYGKKENLHLLAGYGFVLKDNPYNNIVIPIRIIGDLSIDKMINQLVPRRVLNFLPYAPYTSFDPNDLLYLKIALLPKKQRTSYHIGKLMSGGQFIKIEEKMWNYIKSSVLFECNTEELEREEAYLSYITTKLQQQLKERSKKLLSNKKLIYQYRIYHKQTCTQMLQQVEHELEILKNK